MHIIIGILLSFTAFITLGSILVCISLPIDRKSYYIYFIAGSLFIIDIILWIIAIRCFYGILPS